MLLGLIQPVPSALVAKGGFDNWGQYFVAFANGSAKKVFFDKGNNFKLVFIVTPNFIFPKVRETPCDLICFLSAFTLVSLLAIGVKFM